MVEKPKQAQIINDEIDTSMFYDGNRTLTHNCLFNFVVGSRTAGKTFWFKKWAIDDFIKNENQFVYVRRYDKELRKSRRKFFDDIRFKYPDHELKVKGNEFYIDDKLAGYCIVLSTAKIEKSVAYPFVNKICFDEFLIEKSHYNYLPDDVGSFLNLYETIARPGSGHCDVIAFFMANAITWTNPYFLYFNIKQPRKFDKNGKAIWKNGEILMELSADEKLIEAKEKTRFGSIVKGTEYGNHSINNKFILDDETFLERKSPSAKYFFTFVYKDHTFGVWIDSMMGKMWVSESVDPSYKLVYTVTMKDHKPNTMLLKNISRYYHFKHFIENYKLGNVYFESINIKNITYEVIKTAITV